MTIEVAKMEERMRGAIEKDLDEILRDENLVTKIGWVENEIPLKSKRDLVLGYLIGTLETYSLALSAIIESKSSKKADDRYIEEEIQKIIRRRLPEIIEHIDTRLNE